MVQRVHLVCSTENLLKTELNHIQKVFLQINDFPLWVIKQIFAEEDQKNNQQNIGDNGISVINIDSEYKRQLLVSPYQGEQGSRLVKSLKRSITKLLPETTQLEFGFTGCKLSTHFQIKDKTIYEHNERYEHNHDVVYLGTCPENNCSDNYVSENARVSERIIDCSDRDQNSHFFKHSCIKNHPNTSKSDLRSSIVDLGTIIVDEKLQKNHC